MQTAWQQFETAFTQHIESGSFLKITLSAYKGEADLKNIYVKKVRIKNTAKLSFTYRYKTRDIVKNYDPEEARAQLAAYFGAQQFTIITMLSLDGDGELSINKQGMAKFIQRKASQKERLPETHDKVKQRKLSDTPKPYLQALQITDATGTVYKNAQDKYKQINHYIEILSSLLKDFDADRTINVADMGSGKGYLTFALYDYLSNELKRTTKMTGVEYRQDMVDLCNQIARDSGFEGLQFEKGVIEDYEPAQLDVLIALHACDTATDDAIAKGIHNNAELIVVAPCCHKQVRKAMSKGKPDADMDFLLQYGLFFERQAEMITDSIRCMILEYFGYQTKVVDFIADLHTPKNVLIIAQQKKNHKPVAKADFLRALDKIKNYWGIDQHYLEKIL
ncbi:MAG: SAM-dependent methyltransferase [Sphingobacteriales bacterium]|nr:MAG: SAM-dependent methyltransferase [Sphingobacteriales bacterium]